MDFYIKLIALPFVAAAIGWGTNWVAVWLLFHPKKPVSFLGMRFQGVFPKRQNAIAQRIGDLVADDLLSTETIHSQIFESDSIHELKGYISDQIDRYLHEEFPNENPWLSLLVGNKSRDKIRQKLMQKLENSLVGLEQKFPDYLENKVNVRKLVSDKIEGLDSDEVNTLMNNILRNELRFVEWTGAILGFLIGLFQFLLIEFF